MASIEDICNKCRYNVNSGGICKGRDTMKSCTRYDFLLKYKK